MTEEIVIAAFYKFTPLPDFEEIKQPLLEFCNDNNLKGTILLAGEGINATISGARADIDSVLDYLRSDVRLADLEWKESYAAYRPFEKMKVRLKKEIVRLGVDGLDTEQRGEYVEPHDWDDLISDPDVTVIDTRNDYEILLGRFKGAINPMTHEFRSFPKWAKENLDPKKNKRIAMYCTGGIRCEKSTSLLKQLGFEDVYHLQGGILQYLEDTGNKNAMWQGGCFVFDDRISVNSNLEPAPAPLCKKCGQPVNVDEVKYSGANGPNCRICSQ